MFLTKQEESMLQGNYGIAVQYAMEVLSKYGDALKAERMVPITSAHASATALKLVSKAGIKWLKSLVDMEAKLQVPTTSQTTSVEMTHWQELGFDPEEYRLQKEICDIHLKLGSTATWSCTPYLVGHVPPKGTHIVSVESSCIPYMNSVLGARTNRECGQSALLASITGRTPYYGMHLDEGRKGDILVKIETELEEEVDFSLLGYFVGEVAGSKIPVYNNLKFQRYVDLRTLGAAQSTSGAIPMFHAPGVTAESRTVEEAFQGDKPEEVVSFTEEDKKDVLDRICTASNTEVEVIDLGCPFYDLTDIQRVVHNLKGRKIKEGVWLTIWTSASIKNAAERSGFVQQIEACGGRVFCDCCALSIKPLFDGKTLVTNSAKQAGYAPDALKAPVYMGSMKQCVESAKSGKWE